MFSSSPIIAAFARGAARTPPMVAEESSSSDIVEMTTARLKSVSTAAKDLEQESHGEPQELLGDTSRKRRVQNVSTLKSRREVVRWMVSVAGADGEKHVASRAVRQFPLVFRAVGYWVFLGMKAASLFRLHESEVWQGLYRLVVEVFWALEDAT
jgi:hypothetical protein